MIHLVAVELDSSESPYSRGIDNTPASGQTVHLGECRGVCALVVGDRNFCRTDIGTRNKSVYKSRFTDSGISGEQRNFVAKQFTQAVKTLTRTSRNLQNLIAYRSVKICHSIKVFTIIVAVKKVCLVNQQNSVDSVCAGGGKKAVDKGQRCDRMRQSSHKQGTIYICGYYMRRFRQVARTTDYIIPPRNYSRDIGHSVRSRLSVLNHIAHGHRIGGPYAFDTEIPLDQATHLRRTVRRSYNIERACVSYYCSFHNIFMRV